jgi:ketosteroid isomerase-like protein
MIVPLALAGCAAPPAAEAPSFTEEDRAAIVETTRAALEIANSSQDWTQYTETYYAPDAVVLQPNATEIEGQAAIAEWLGMFPTMTDIRYEQVMIEGAGDLAYVFGRYFLEFAAAEGEEPMVDQGKYIEIWKRQADGGWKIAYDIFNSDTPLPEE